MAHDITDAVLSRLANFTVALVYREDGSKERMTLGTGVLVTIGGRRGLLTCGHVADRFEKLKDVGMASFANGRRHFFDVKFDLNLILASSDSFKDSENVLDLAFTLFPPALASSIEATDGVFLNIDKNRGKVEAFASTKRSFVDAILGMVKELGGESSVDGEEFTSNLRGSLYTGSSSSKENGLVVFEPTDSIEKLPKSFGGMSGSGVWRVYYETNGSEASLENVMLCGVVSWQIPGEKLIACQGWDRIDQALIPEVCKNLPAQVAPAQF